MNEPDKFPRPDVFQFLNYREFMKAMIEHLRAEGNYSARTFAKRAGLGSPSYTKMIIDGKRSMSQDVAKRIALSFGLRKRETEFFEKLVMFNQTSSSEVRESLYEDILLEQRGSVPESLDSALYDFFSNAYAAPFMEALPHLRWPRDADRVAKELGVSPAELERALDNLQTIGLIEKKDGKWKKTKEILETRTETQSLLVRKYHRENLKLAQKKLDELEDADRDNQGLTIALTEEQFQELKKIIFSFVSKLNERLISKKNPKAVYQINTQVYPIVSLRED